MDYPETARAYKEVFFSRFFVKNINLLRNGLWEKEPGPPVLVSVVLHPFFHREDVERKPRLAITGYEEELTIVYCMLLILPHLVRELPLLQVFRGMKSF